MRGTASWSRPGRGRRSCTADTNGKGLERQLGALGRPVRVAVLIVLCASFGQAASCGAAGSGRKPEDDPRLTGSAREPLASLVWLQ